jgi:hypothetical protein
MVLSLERAMVASHGVEVVAGYLAAGEDSVVGSAEEWVVRGPSMEPRGIGRNLSWHLTNGRFPSPAI